MKITQSDTDPQKCVFTICSRDITFLDSDGQIKTYTFPVEGAMSVEIPYELLVSELLALFTEAADDALKKVITDNGSSLGGIKE